MTAEISVGNLSVWVDAPASPAKARVLLVHGLGEHSGRHYPTINALTRQGIEVVRFDLRGMGKSKGLRQYIESFDDYVDDLESVYHWIAANRPRLPLFLMGHSLGGAISLRFAGTRRPELSGLILSAPGFIPGNAVSPVKLALAKVLGRFLPKVRVPSTLDLKGLSRDPQIAADYAADPLNCLFNTINQANCILPALKLLPEAAKNISLPVLIAHGDADRFCLIEGSRQLHQTFPSNDKTLHEFPGGYHELHNEPSEREAYLRLLGEWIAKRLPAPH